MPRQFDEVSSEDDASSTEGSEPSEVEDEISSNEEDEIDEEDLSHLPLYERLKVQNERNVQSAHSMKPHKKIKRQSITLQFRIIYIRIKNEKRGEAKEIEKRSC